VSPWTVEKISLFEEATTTFFYQNILGSNLCGAFQPVM
jgi:hypothetical protein